MASLKKKRLRLNASIKKYFGDDGFDEGIARVESDSLFALAHMLGVEPSKREEIIKALRQIWSSDDIELRRFIVNFFQEHNHYYKAPSQESSEEKQALINELSSSLHPTPQESDALYKAFCDTRIKKITASKIAYKLDYIRKEVRTQRITDAIDATLTYDDRLEIIHAFTFDCHDTSFSKQLRCYSQPFAHTLLANEQEDEIITTLTQLKDEAITTHQARVKQFCSKLITANPYVHFETLIAYIKALAPETELYDLSLSETEYNAYFKVHNLPPCTIIADDLLLNVPCELLFERTKQTFSYTLPFHVSKSAINRAILFHAPLTIEEEIADFQHEHEALFLLEYENLFSKAKQQAAILQRSNESIERSLLALLKDFLGASLHLSHKRAKKILFAFSSELQEAIYKKQRQELLARSIRDFKSLFEQARMMHRRLILNIGPTNSGKTYNAMQQLKTADTGLYLAPLRLLALEGYETLQALDVKASLITGEEQITQADDTHISATIEMCNFDVDVDVCVIDEIQMIADRDRGWAWANALIGVPARTIIMTGSANVLPIIEFLATYLGESLEVNHFHRKSPLHLQQHITPSKAIEPQSAIIAFSRREVLRLKQQFAANKSVSVIYGNLSPEVRREEARRFKEGESELLIATDAIAMGLNLPIKTLLFSTLMKFDGQSKRDLYPHEVHQIAGRAGRFNKHEAGYVGALNAADMRKLHTIYTSNDALLELPIHVMINFEQIALISTILEEQRIEEIFLFFFENMHFNGPFQVASMETMLAAAPIVDRYELTLMEKFNLCCAPLTLNSDTMMHSFEHYAHQIAKKQTIHFKTFEPKTTHASTLEELLEAEDHVKIITLYLWLSYRFEEQCNQTALALKNRSSLNRYIENSLKQTHFISRCKQCTKPLPLFSKHAICESCFHKLNKLKHGIKPQHKRRYKRSE